MLRTLAALTSVVIVGVSFSGCGKEKEQCHLVSLSLGSMDNSYAELRHAAEVGNQEAFDAEKARLETSLKTLDGIELTGSSLRAESVRADVKRVKTDLPQAIDAYAKLIAAVKADPKLGDKYSGGRPPLSAGGSDFKEDSLRAVLTVGRKRACD